MTTTFEPNTITTTPKRTTTISRRLPALGVAALLILALSAGVVTALVRFAP